MESTSQKSYINREHRFSISDLENLDAVIVRTSEKGVSAEFPAGLLDFSRKGLKLKVPVCLRFEENVRVRLIYQGAHVWYDGVASIRHIRSEGDQSWIVGCSIEPGVREEIIEQLAAVSGKERRRHPRFPVCGDGTIQVEGQTQKCLASLKNMSEGGFCLIVSAEHEVGDRLKFEIEDPEFVLHSIDACVRWQSKTDDGFLTGCSFADVDGFEKLIRCVKDANEKKREKMSRFVMLIAAITMLVPPGVSVLLQSNAAATQNSIKKIMATVESASNHTVATMPEPTKTADNGGSDRVDPITTQLDPTTPQVDPKTTQSDPVHSMPLPNNNATSQTVREPDTTVPATVIGEPTALSPLREWVDNSGQFKIEARLEFIGRGFVRLRKPDGSLKTVPTERLSREDLIYLLEFKSEMDH